MQVVPAKFCFACQGCCRFHNKNTVWLPYNIAPINHQDFYVCPHLNITTNKCKIYSNRPLDCKIYPFVLTKKDNKTYIAIHKLCLFVEENKDKLDLKPHINNLIKYLSRPKIKKFLCSHPDFIKEYPGEELIFLEQINIDIDLIELSVKDKKLVQEYLSYQKHNLSVYSFANIYAWKCFYKIFYCLIDNNLCIFFKDKSSCFMNITPLGKNITVSTIDKCFDIMNSYNKNKELSRIENVENNFNCRDAINRVSTYRFPIKSFGNDKAQYILKPKFQEYLYLRRDLIGLKGDKFKSKRSALNYFLKHYKYEFLPFKISDSKGALNLYKNWAKDRKSKISATNHGEPALGGNNIYCLMIDDSLTLHKFLMHNFNKLNLSGFVVKTGGKIKAYSFGYPMNKETFCIFAEITDLNIKGISQFIFWKFCKELANFKFINTMDDSGLSNLKKVKMSYHPYKLINSFILSQKLC